jgi:hypothetical protein
MFIQSNFSPNKKTDPAMQHNGDNAICRFEFMELLIRLATAKYGKGQRTNGIADALVFLFVESIMVRSWGFGVS